MEPREPSSAATFALHPPGLRTDRRRIAWHAIAALAAATLAWLVFAAYRQPELILDLAAMRLC